MKLEIYDIYKGNNQRSNFKKLSIIPINPSEKLFCDPPLSDKWESYYVFNDLIFIPFL